MEASEHRLLHSSQIYVREQNLLISIKAFGGAAP